MCLFPNPRRVGSGGPHARRSRNWRKATTRAWRRFRGWQQSLATEPSRKRLLVVLGAGSTIHAGAPSTPKITERVSGILDEPIRSVVTWLCTQRGKDGFNFETILACLEELDEFKLRQNSLRAWDRIEGVLSAFADLKPDFAARAEGSFLTARWRLINGLSLFVWERTRSPPLDGLKLLFDRLREHFSLTVVTLNFDDIIDRTGDWYDGFGDAGGVTPGFGTFDTAGFQRRSESRPAVLLHIHGSVRFGFGPHGTAREIVRYNDPDAALQSALHATHDNTSPEPAPIISGQRKDRWMTMACVPFGYYHHSFVNEACSCPRVLIAGYGFNDPHITAWIMHGEKMHANNWRGVLVDKSANLSTFSKLPRVLALGGDDGDFPPKEPDRIQKIIDHLSG